MELREIQLSDIKGPAFQFRIETKELDPDLVESIKNHGVKQPILLRPNRPPYQIIAGLQRFKACKQLGRKTIPAILEALDDKTAYEIALTENVHRKNLSPEEEGLAFKKYLDDYKFGKMSELAHRLDKPMSFISRRIALIEQPKEILSSAKLTQSHIEELFPIKDKETKLEISRAVRDEDLTAQQTAEVVKLVKERELDVPRAVQVTKIREQAKKAAESVAETLTEAVIETGKEVRAIETSERRKLMQQYTLLATVIGALEEGQLFCPEHKEKMLVWDGCKTPVTETQKALGRELGLK